MSLFAATLLMLAGGTADFWMVDDGAAKSRESIVFVDRSKLNPRPDGVINFAYIEERNGARVNRVKSVMMTAWAVCKTREFINDYEFDYGTDGRLIREGKVNETQRRVPAPDSTEGRLVAFACGDTRGATQLPTSADASAYADGLYAQGHPGMARAGAAGSGLSGDYWLVYPTVDDQVTNLSHGNDDYDEIIVLVDRSSISHRPDGWTPFDYVDVRNGSEAKNFKWRRLSTRMNCKTHQFADERIQVYKNNGAPSTAVRATMPPQPIETGSFNDVLLSFVCSSTPDAEHLPRGADPVAYADNLYAREHSQNARAPTPRTPATAPAPRAGTATPPPRAGGMGASRRGTPEFWFVTAAGGGHMVFLIDKASISRKPGGKAEFRREMVNDPNGNVTVVKWQSEFDCARRTYRDLSAFTYRGNGTPIGAVAVAPEQAIQDSTVIAEFFHFVCQGKEETAVKLDPTESTTEFFSAYRATYDATHKN